MSKIKCEECEQALEDICFWSLKDGSKDHTCKYCLCKKYSLDNKEDILNFCKRYDIPFFKEEWDKRYEREKEKGSYPRMVFGKYLATMKLPGYKNWCYEDTFKEIDEINKRYDKKIIDYYVDEINKIGLINPVKSEDVAEAFKKLSKKLKENNMEQQYDNVKNPKHYNREGALECFDEFVAIYGIEAAKHACLFNIHKYRYRAADKNGMEDLKKSDWYMKKYIELNESDKKSCEDDYDDFHF